MTGAPDPLATEAFMAMIAARLGLQLDERIAQDAISRRAAVHGMAIWEYLRRVDEPGELRILASELTIGETYFFRHTEQLDAFIELAVPNRLAARGTALQLDVLSAGCSSGEEPYTLAMLLHDRVPPGWRVGVQGVDIDSRAIERAVRGRYSRWSLRATPRRTEQRWFKRDGDDAVLGPEIRGAVVFAEHNLIGDAGLWGRTWDIVFCRNVLMYFTPPQGALVIERLVRALAPGGYLFLGHAEAVRASRALRITSLDPPGALDELETCSSHGAFYYRRRHPHEVPQAERAHPAIHPVSATSSGPLPIVRLPSIMPPVIMPPVMRAVTRAPARPARPANDPDITPSVPTETIAASLAAAIASLIHADRFEEARALIAACAVDTADLDLLLLRALVHVNLGEVRVAADACRRLLVDDPSSAAAHYVLAQCHEISGDWASAVRHASATLALDPSFALAHWQLARLARRAGDASTARLELASAIALFEGEDGERWQLYGGGFGRGSLLGMCQAELAAIGGEP